MTSLYEIIRSNTTDFTKENSVAGAWFSISVKPDFCSNEILNIGVAFRDEKQIHSKFIDNFSRFNSIFDETAEDELKFLTKVAATALKKDSLERPAPSIIFSELKYARGESVNEILNRLFYSTVTLGRPRTKSGQKPRFLNNTNARKLTFDEVKRKAGILAEKLISDETLFSFTNNSKNFYLDIPLKSEELIGTVISAGFSNPKSIEISFLKAYIDLVTASLLDSERMKSKAIFVLRPKNLASFLEKSRINQIDNVIDIFDWKVQKQNIQLKIEDDAPKLADNILSAVSL